jgi:hypothetical protein
VDNMLGDFSIDSSRIYLAGFSWGGRLTGEIVPAPEYGVDRVTILMAAGDFDHNRRETYGGSRNCHFIQEPPKGYAIMSAANFEKAIRLLDAGDRSSRPRGVRGLLPTSLATVDACAADRA